MPERSGMEEKTKETSIRFHRDFTHARSERGWRTNFAAMKDVFAVCSMWTSV